MSLHYIINEWFKGILQLMMVGLYYIAMGLKATSVLFGLT